MGIVKLKISDPELRDRVFLPDYREAIRRGAARAPAGGEEVEVGRDYITLFSPGPPPEGLGALEASLSGALGVPNGPGGLLAPAPAEYYGLALEYLVDSTRFFRRGISLELVDAEEMDLLLREDRELPQNLSRAPGDLMVLQTCRQYGRDSREYRAVKSQYLGTRRSYTLELYEDDTVLDGVLMGDWYRVRIGPEDGAPNARFLRDEEGGPENSLDCAADLLPLNPPDQAGLKEHFQLEPGGVSGGGPLKTIAPATVFTQVLVHNVNQALAVSIRSAAGLECIFDLGCSGQSVGATAICTAIHNFNGGGNGTLPVLISHWHGDHYRLIPHIPAADLAKLCLHAPEESAGVNAQAARNAVTTAGGTLHLYGPVNGQVPAGGHAFNPRLVMYKLQYTPGGGTANHLHHKGIYATVQLASGCRVFLSGDCTYSAIPAGIRGAGYHALQVSHHGGNYHLDTAAGNSAHIPAPAQAGAPAALYSYGLGNHHGHPEAGSVGEHRTAGWTQANERHTPGNPSLQIL